MLTGNILIMELREEFSVCLNNEALSRVRMYLYRPFYSRERENALLRETILSENHTGQCKRTGGCYNELVVAFYSTGGGVKGKKIYTC